MSILVRNVQKADIPAVVRLKIDGWKSAYKDIIDDDFLNGLDDSFNVQVARMEGDYNSGGFVVAESENEVVGFCRYAFDNHFSPDQDGVDCELLAIYVKPDLKYLGIGTKLFEHVVNEFKKQNKHKMILWCLKDNEPAKKFYAKMGGEIIRERTIELGDKKYLECGFEYNF